jgi:hypothetical protein
MSRNDCEKYGIGIAESRIALFGLAADCLLVKQLCRLLEYEHVPFPDQVEHDAEPKPQMSGTSHAA